MAITGNIQRFFNSVKDVATPILGAAGKSAGGVAKAGFKGAVGLGGKVIDGMEAVGKIDKKSVVKNIKENTGKAVDFTLGTSKPIIGTSKTRLGKIAQDIGGKTGYQLSSNLNLLDEVGTHVRGISEGAYRLGKGSQFDIKLGGNKSIQLNTGLFKASDSSLIGVKTTALGTAGLMAASTLSGTGQAAKSFNDNRQGQRSGQVQGHAPTQYTSAYQNNGGATGDLVFALNNLRHGGMM